MEQNAQRSREWKSHPTIKIKNFMEEMAFVLSPEG